MDERLSRPNTIPWPPILLGLAIAGGTIATILFPGKPVYAGQEKVGMVLVAAGIGLIGWAFVLFLTRRTNILPHRAADTLMTDGPFAWSRNPIYLGEVVALYGAALIFSSGGFALAGLALTVAITELAIKREEAHLEAKFGDAYRDYMLKVRRWF
jgi:protein-S-isoprenylcysteine O-methyltransferase Ste14